MRKSLFLPIIIGLVLFGASRARADGPNLVSNPGMEAGTATTPTGWLKGGWGTNNRALTYPVTGFGGTKAAQVKITAYTSGDAKWYFKDVPVKSGTAYHFSDHVLASTRSYVTLRYTLTDGTFKYLDIGLIDASTSWQVFSGFFTTPMNVKSLTVFHLIKTVGTLTTDDYSLNELPSDPTKLSEGIVSINFDDGWLSAYQNAFPILDAAGLKATDFIITNYMKGRFPAYMNPEEVLDLQARGHVIGAHTQSHPMLTQLSTAQATDEIRGSRDDLLTMGINPVDFFSYPFGDYNASIEQIVKSLGFRAARSSDGGANQKGQDIWALRRFPVTNTTTVADIDAAIDQAVSQKTWLIILFHEVNTSGDQYSITPANFQQVVNYLKGKNVPMVTMDQGMNMLTQ